MKELWKKWNDINLILRILVFLVVGAVLGVVATAAGAAPYLDWISILGTIFTGLLKAVAPILVFFIIISSLANAKADGSMGTIIVLYLICTFIAAFAAVVASFIFPVTVTLTGIEVAEQASPSGIGEVLGTLITNAVSNPVAALANANYLGILVWAVLIGVAMRAAGEATRAFFSDVSALVNTMVKWIISLAPFGIMGLVYSAVSTSGLAIFVDYGKLLAVLVGTMIFVALVAYPVIIFLAARINPYPLVLRCLKDSGLTAFFTRSSAANIPVNMTLCQKLHLNPDNYGVSIPLGATINMGGAAVTIAVMALAACNTVGISVDIPTAVILSALAAVSACGASGVAGGSLLLIPLACSLFGIDADIAMQMVSIGFIIGVIQDSCETALNSSSDVMLTATAEYRAARKAGQKPNLNWDK